MRHLASIFKYTFLVVFSAFVLVPIIATFLGGFKSNGELRVNPIGIPREFRFEAYADIIKSALTWNYAYNSLKVALLTVLLVLIVSSMAAFAFSHIKFFGKNALYAYLLLGLMFPLAVAIVPLFTIINNILDIFNTHWAIILPQVAFGIGAAVLFFRAFFERLPYELFEAARVDGISYLGFYTKFILPLSTPILATVGVMTLVTSWNAFLLPLIMLGTDKSLHTWPLGLMNFRGEFSVEWNRILAFISLNLSPAIIFFLLAQRYIVAGLTGGSVKG
jgi:raffinose/stachyose/melibiose transport system permease protein